MRHDKHVFRLFFLLILALAGFQMLRYLFIPASFGQYGHYRGDNVAEQMAMPVRHGGTGSCRPCHAAEYGEHESGDHKTVPCEDCHAPLAGHADGDRKIGDMPIERGWVLCARCHRLLAARPQGFPQVQVETHLTEMGVDLEREICIVCHQPHSPMEGLE